MRAKEFQAKAGNQLPVRDGLALEMLTVKNRQHFNCDIIR